MPPPAGAPDVGGDNALEITSSVLSAVLKIALLVSVGMKLEVQGMLNGTKRKCLSALAMDVCLPCLLFSSVMPQAKIELFEEGWQLLLWPIVYAVVGTVVGACVCLAVGTPIQHLGSAAACTAFPNVNGFPVSIISALGPTIPISRRGFSPMVFLALIQLTDGLVKYTIGPVVFKRDLRAVQRAREKMGIKTDGDLPLGASLRTIHSEHGVDIDKESDIGEEGANSGPPLRKPSQGSQGPASMTLSLTEQKISPAKSDSRSAHAEVGSDFTQQRLSQLEDLREKRTEFGLEPVQYKVVEPDWSRFDAGGVAFSGYREKIASEADFSTSLTQPLMGHFSKVGNRVAHLAESSKDWFKQLVPPQVAAVLLALAIGMGPTWFKRLLFDPELAADGGQPLLGFVFGTAKQLGGGFVPLQMISLGGRLVNIVGPKGPLAAGGEAGPTGKAKLLKIGVAVGFSRMFLAPACCYLICLMLRPLIGARPLAFWAPALIVASMPTANNMSTMADLVGSGRSISAASTAMQLMASPFILAVTLTLLLTGARFYLL